jgi:hypothetical protein
VTQPRSDASRPANVLRTCDFPTPEKPEIPIRSPGKSCRVRLAPTTQEMGKSWISSTGEEPPCLSNNAALTVDKGAFVICTDCGTGGVSLDSFEYLTCKYIVLKSRRIDARSFLFYLKVLDEVGWVLACSLEVNRPP